MKKLSFPLVLLLALAIEIKATRVVANPCSKKEIASTSCKGAKDCLYPNPKNCSSYIQCKVNADNITGTPIVRPCPKGLEWNDIEKICIYPTFSTCPDQIKFLKLSLPTTTTGKPGPPISNQCSKEEIASTSCKGPKDCLYPNPENCNSYIQCEVNADNITGTPIVRPCSPGLQWNDRDKICDLPSNSTCRGGSTETTVTRRTTTTRRPSRPSSTTRRPTRPSTTPKEPTTASPPVCSGDNDYDDSNLDLTILCGGYDVTRPVTNTNSQNRFILCNVNHNGSKTNRILKCSSGLLWDKDRLTCEYAGLVNRNGPSF